MAVLNFGQKSSKFGIVILYWKKCFVINANKDAFKSNGVTLGLQCILNSSQLRQVKQLWISHMSH